jgi:hypothetical protein
MEIADPRIDPKLVPEGSIAKVMNGPRNEYHDLPSVITPRPAVITRWTPTEEERLRILGGEDIYVTLVGLPINPLFVTVGPVDWNEIV